MSSVECPFLTLMCIVVPAVENFFISRILACDRVDLQLMNVKRLISFLSFVVLTLLVG